MRRFALPTALLAFALLAPAAPVRAADPPDCPGKVYGKGKRAICLPLGAASFADEVVAFAPGERPSEGVFAEPRYSLGEPDYIATSKPGFLSLGCQGELVLRFTDNRLVDVEGPDLFVFEVGPVVEPTALAISVDGGRWTEVGRIEGARADVDIAPFVAPGEAYAYVRLTNAGTQCGGRHSGADIDAVAAVGAAMRLSLDSAVLFDVGQSALRPEARAALDALATQVKAYGPARLVVEGHTDATGGDADNQRLSEARAAAVWQALRSRLGLAEGAATVRGFGESRPVADNASEDGRARNRRVDILVQPGAR